VSGRVRQRQYDCIIDIHCWSLYL